LIINDDDCKFNKSIPKQKTDDLVLFYTKKQWVTSQPPIAHFNLNLNYEKFICLFTLQRYVSKFILPNKTTKKNAKGKYLTF